MCGSVNFIFYGRGDLSLKNGTLKSATAPRRFCREVEKVLSNPPKDSIEPQKVRVATPADPRGEKIFCFYVPILGGEK